MAVEVLKSRGVPEDHILFLNLIASPQGVQNFAAKFPKLKVVTAFIDQVRQPNTLFRSTSKIRTMANDYIRAWTRRSMSMFIAVHPRSWLTPKQLHRPWARRFWGQVLHHLRFRIAAQ